MSQPGKHQERHHEHRIENKYGRNSGRHRRCRTGQSQSIRFLPLRPDRRRSRCQHDAAGIQGAPYRLRRQILFLELAVGYNTPAIIKYNFWRMTAANPKATYACLNHGEAYAPDEIKRQSICIDGDIGEILTQL